MAPPGRPRRKGHGADAEPTVVPNDTGADPEAPGPTETITIHPGGTLNPRFFIPGLEHHSPAPASQPPTSHGTPPTPPPPVTPVPQQSAHQHRHQPDPDDDNPFTSTPELREDRVHCIFCCAQKKSTSFGHSITSTSNWQHHLLMKHLGLWVEACDRLKVKITADKAEGSVTAYWESKGQDSKQNSSLPSGFDKVPGFSLEAFIDALVAFIVSNDQSFNVVESPELCCIFLMLREELTDDDIPCRTQIWKRVMEIWEDHLKQLSKEMQVKSPSHVTCGQMPTLCPSWLS
ncbi:uncharacterized protein EV420DRAFT_1487004 [Desarmillaria tabescens]|uniref:Uncharacterized protein n=1 Tax=Armillaria tabescens TaxID=1929756 RepID=A0AA39J979_ARMTA|nr:uncharacterized protein EV420DRAFT_1487004 [Desarmillaria tabescens]KAK0437727.1 hypothetical protein EV420DRAFT_1487004 [Desarmillaria tabescens]